MLCVSSTKLVSISKNSSCCCSEACPCIRLASCDCGLVQAVVLSVIYPAHDPSVHCSSRGVCCMLSYLHNVSCTINTQGRKHRRQFCKVLIYLFGGYLYKTQVASGQAQFIPVRDSQPTRVNYSHLCLLASNSLSSRDDATSSRLFACPLSNLQTYTHLTCIWPRCLR